MRHAVPQLPLSNSGVSSQQCLTEQVRLVYRNAPAGMLTNVINGLITAAVLWQAVPRHLVMLWLIALMSVSLVRWLQVARCRHTGISEAAAWRWGVYFAAGAACNGGIWGALGFLGSIYLSQPYAVFLAFTIGGMSAGTIAMSGAFIPAYISYIFPALLPLALGLLSQGTAMYLAMGAMIAIFAVAVFFLGRNVNASIVRSIQLSLERAQFVQTLRKANEDAIENNRRLAKEVQERIRAESALRTAHDELEAKVRVRTAELSDANTHLRHEIQQRQRVEDLLRALHQITTAQGWDFQRQLQSLLETGCQLFGMPIGVLSRIEDEHYEVVAVVTPDNIVAPGDVFRLAEVGCWSALQREGRVGVEEMHIAASGGCRCFNKYTVQACFGVTIIVAGQTYGTLGFAGFEPRSAPFTATDKEILKLMAQWIGGALARQQAETALRDSKERYRTLIETINDWVWEVNEYNQYTYCSPQSRWLLGYEPDELVGRTPMDLMPEAEAIRVGKLFAVIAGSRKPFFGLENENIRKDGTPIILETSGVPIYRPDGVYCGYRGTDRDITARKRAEEALFHEKERAQVTLHSIGDGVITTDDRGGVDYMNPVAEALTGWAADEASGQTLEQVFRLVDEQDRAPLPNPVARCLRERRVLSLSEHTRLISRSGQEHAIEDSVAPIQTRDGKVVGAVVVFHDVTETRRLRRQLAHQAAHDALTGLVNRREFERRLEQALTSAKRHAKQHVLCYLDLDRFKFVNDTAGHVAGDKLLTQVTDLLKGAVRSRDTLARLGGDEFSLLVENCPLEAALMITRTLITALQNFQFHWQQQSFTIGVSVGLAPINVDTESVEQLLKQADTACYAAKKEGGNQVRVYTGTEAIPIERHAFHR